MLKKDKLYEIIGGMVVDYIINCVVIKLTKLVLTSNIPFVVVVLKISFF